MKILPLYITCISSCFFIGCAAYTSTQFTEYRGPAIQQGKGGTVKVVDEIEIWTTGTPNRKYKILGIVDQNHLDNNSVMSAIAGASKDSELLKVAKEHGGDAIIFVENTSKVTGYTTSGFASGVGTGSYMGDGYGGAYTGSSTIYGTAPLAST